MGKNYGVPYKGSKQKIAREIIDQMPPARNFFDLFAGGCAVAHAAMESGKYEHVYVNDLDWRGPTLFADAIAGRYRDESRWISREDFARLKDTDAYVALCWSFGNNERDYLYAREIEPYKHAVHAMLFASTIQERHVLYGSCVRELAKASDKSLRSLRRLQSLESLERLQSLQSLQPPTVSAQDYRMIEILPDSAIYCDIPYKDTNVYNVGEFDYNAFYMWASAQEQPVFISEYAMPDGFREIWRREKRCTLAAANNAKSTIERLYVPQHQYQPCGELSALVS